MKLQLDDIQGNILVGYRLPLVAHLFADVRSENLARCWEFLGAVPVTPAAKSAMPPYTVNLGLTYPALAALAGDEDRKIRTAFPAFAAGMRARALLLRDPEVDTWAHRHLWVAIHAKDESALKTGVEAIRRIGPDFDHELHGAAIVKDDHWFEHFGFRDDIASPVVEGTEAIREPKNLAGNGKRDENGRWIPLKAGEFVLGYPNESNGPELGAELMRVFRNGTFAVFRDLEQNVDAFRRYTTEEARRIGFVEEDLASNIIGRRRDGMALIDANQQPNDFDFQGDVKGHQCPLGAHIRRANHRDPDVKEGGRHRLIRRGRPYEKPANGDGKAPLRGLYFVAMNASIEDQFEFIQRQWLNDRASTDGDLDPLVGVGPSRMFVVEGQQPPLTLVDMPSFVTFRGGEYYFMPGISELRELARSNRHLPMQWGSYR